MDVPGRLPAVVYNEKAESRMLQLNTHDFDLLLKHHRAESLILDLEIDGASPVKVLIKEIQREPVSDALLHVDFQEVSMTRKIRVHIPVILLGEPVGVTQDGGILDHLLREVDVECLPGDVPPEIEIDVSHLGMGDTILVRDLPIGEKVALLTETSVAVAHVSAPTIEEEPTPEEVAAAEGAEPAVIGEEGEAEKAEGAEEKKAGDEEEKPESE